MRKDTRNAKVTFVSLANGLNEREFTFEHAERLLRLTRGGWKLADDRYEFEGGILRIKKKNDSDAE